MRGVSAEGLACDQHPGVPRRLPAKELADREAIVVTPGHEIRYRMREIGPPFLESVVILTIAPNAAGGTSLRILHEPETAKATLTSRLANLNGPMLRLAA